MIYDYPKEVKPFYVRVNDDGKTVAAMDLVLPQVHMLYLKCKKLLNINFQSGVKCTPLN